MYKETNTDKGNKQWFDQDKQWNSLKRITVSGCNIRGIFPSSIEFKYPITAIAGPNGSGKSTLLAIACCAFHNNTTFYPQSLVGKKYAYYTYKDFFVFTSEESGLTSEIQIKAEYLSNATVTPPETLSKDIRKKKPSGKWNDYNTRPSRVVSFMGINRILPPSESSKHKSYRKSFGIVSLSADEQKILIDSLKEIFRREYTEISVRECNGSKLFSTKRDFKYTGFNMGAGENAVIALLYEIIKAGEGALIVVDEIELGIHISAQERLIKVLKEMCLRKKCQIICSTHSANILNALPPSARVLIESSGNETKITSDVSTEFALGVMSGKDVSELTIFVEDEIGEGFLKGIMDSDLRHRVTIFQIGSADGPIPRQMAARYREGNHKYCSFMDGDKRSSRNVHEKTMKNELGDRLHLDDQEFTQYLDDKMNYLPGNEWPEKYLMEELLKQNEYNLLCDSWGVKDSEIREYCNSALTAGKHNEIYTMGEKLSIDKKIVFSDIINEYKRSHASEVTRINEFLRGHLK